jgi:hypothetical protein
MMGTNYGSDGLYEVVTVHVFVSSECMTPEFNAKTIILVDYLNFVSSLDRQPISLFPS